MDTEHENKADPRPVENKSVDFGARMFIISDKQVNKCINLIDRMKREIVAVPIQEDAIELLQSLQENPYQTMSGEPYEEKEV